MDVLVTWCFNCEKETVVCPASSVADLSTKKPTDFIGFKCHFRLTPEQRAALAEHVEMTLFDGGYAGLEPVEGGRANLCLVVRRR